MAVVVIIIISVCKTKNPKQEYVDGHILTQFEVEDYHSCAVR